MRNGKVLVQASVDWLYEPGAYGWIWELAQHFASTRWPDARLTGEHVVYVTPEHQDELDGEVFTVPEIHNFVWRMVAP